MKKKRVLRSMSTTKFSSNFLNSNQQLNPNVQPDKLCHGVYKYTLTTKGNLLIHLQTAHPERLHDYKEE